MHVVMSVRCTQYYYLEVAKTSSESQVWLLWNVPKSFLLHGNRVLLPRTRDSSVASLDGSCGSLRVVIVCGTSFFVSVQKPTTTHRRSNCRQNGYEWNGHAWDGGDGYGKLYTLQKNE